MKILAIRGKNMASLEGEFAIDFREEPLRSAGIFAITGCTGAGKSTLLDTMCIALFESSPRINRMKESADITDVNNETVKENDCRNILRRGATDGYAECDFLALDNREYRVRWSVRRSRNKANGRLQESQYTLFDIVGGDEIQGTKTTLKERVRELLGLTYEQFTRAVLLAQGDFATFLKASSREKSEILEKLTGTEIYSAISQKIYEKCRAAEATLNGIGERLDGISLLSDEETAALDAEQKRLANENKEAEKEAKKLSGHLDWHDRFLILDNELKKAIQENDAANHALEQSKESIKRIAQIESIQPIRDTYIHALSLDKQSNDTKQRIDEYTQRAQKEKKELADAEILHKAHIKEQEKINAEWNSARPRIREAQKIEAEGKSKSTLSDLYISELQSMRKQFSEATSKCNALAAEIEKNNRQTIETSQWFARHNTYSNVIAKSEASSIAITEIINAEKEIESKNTLLAKAHTMLQKHSEQLAVEHKEAERLNNILTVEIATLRKRLVDGEPCPVCGSRHHEPLSSAGDTLQEEMLAMAKKRVEESIAHITAGMENSKGEIISLETAIGSYTALKNRKTEELISMLSALPAIGSLHGCDNITERLQEEVHRLQHVAQQWKQMETLSNELANRKSVAESNLAHCNRNVAELQNRIKEKEQQCSMLAEELNSLRARHRDTLGANGSAEDLEQHYNKAVEQANKAVTESSDARNMLYLKCEKTAGLIASAKESMAAIEKERIATNLKISEFTATLDSPMTHEEFHSLCTTPPEEAAAMRRKIEQLQNRCLSATAMLAERQRNIDLHRNATNRPADGENREQTAKAIAQISAETKRRMERLSEIAVALRINNTKLAQTAELRKEFAQQEERTNDWRRLNELLGSADGKKFRVIAQGYTLDIMLAYANKHLKDISSRYELARTSPDSLSIKVTDLDMLSESRSVHSLSGGESFLVSLALALALSSLSSNRMNIESLFIDEGFGSLDSETLSVAMDALDNLQSQGRKIGVISHLGDMTERIPTQIRVIKCSSGRSRMEITSKNSTK